MNKLPVGKTILDAYGFTFGHLGTVIGLIWFPMVVSALLNFLPELSGDYGAATQADAGANAVENLAVLLLTLLLSAIMYVAVSRQALGLRQGPAVFHFALGQPEFRVYGALLLVYLLIGIAALALLGAQNLGGPAAIVAGVAVLPCLFAILYLTVRFAFLLVPVIVSENRIDFAKMWTLTRGNFWRIFAVLLAIVLPIWLIECSSVIALMGRELLSALPPVGSTDPQEIERHMTTIQDVFHKHSSELMFIGLIVAPFSLGLTLSASSFAYRALAGSSRGVSA